MLHSKLEAEKISKLVLLLCICNQKVIKLQLDIIFIVLKFGTN